MVVEPGRIGYKAPNQAHSVDVSSCSDMTSGHRGRSPDGQNQSAAWARLERVIRSKAQPEIDADFAAFVGAHGALLVHLAELLSGDPHDVADVTQAALEKAYLRWRRITADDPLAYVRRVLVNQHRDTWRRRRRRSEWLYVIHAYDAQGHLLASI
jgi:hypothetical protein